MSKCLEAVSVSNIGSVVRVEKSISNDGFSITLDVRTIGYLLCLDDIRDFSRSLASTLKRLLNSFEVSLAFDKEQLDLPF